MSETCTCPAQGEESIAAHDYYCAKKLEYNNKWEVPSE